ncbi:hypothetical protein ACIHJG_19505 [Streptomyces sp. NPDC052415]|jgi:hypothetical protein|uniref:hypothetical protein n=1 Tax=Streptomyces sp. NPDC052415 TaxID=3365690 RepID=UPI0037D49A70
MRRPGQAGAEQRARADFTGGVYGSLLAASVILGAGSLGDFPRAELIALLLLTGTVFWLAHVHAKLFGERLADRALNRREALGVCREEWPILRAVLPPVLAIALSPLLRLDMRGTIWLALCVAVVGQVGWSVRGARQAGASTRLVIVTASINLLLGLLIIAVKLFVKH